MKQLVKIGAILGAAMVTGAAITGVAVATTTATTTHPVTLCADSRGNLTYPGAGKSCSSRQSEVVVASSTDVANLATRLDAAEATIAAQGQTILSQAQVGAVYVDETRTEMNLAGTYPVIVATLDLPAGSYTVSSLVDFRNPNNQDQEVECDFQDPYVPATGVNYVTVGANGLGQVQIEGQTMVTLASPQVMSVKCARYNTAGLIPLWVARALFTAVRLGTVHSSVDGIPTS
jgi:hypothetical protein